MGTQIDTATEDITALDITALDITTLASIGGEAALGLVRRRIAEAGHPAVRDAHGYVFQRLINNEPTIGELAAALRMTQQGASKHVAELERLRYVERVADASDNRIRRVRLSAQGREVIAIARSVRAEIDGQLRGAVGEEALQTARTVLSVLLDVVGRTEQVRSRTVPAPEESAPEESAPEEPAPEESAADEPAAHGPGRKSRPAGGPIRG